MAETEARPADSDTITVRQASWAGEERAVYADAVGAVLVEDPVFVSAMSADDGVVAGNVGTVHLEVVRSIAAYPEFI
ncbi:MAG TPA: hypothetical protein PLU30_12780 [Verrucomicrobiae bacterium]|nr:hypothetical protein [Verrucomicrobiae bacterium]